MTVYDIKDQSAFSPVTYIYIPPLAPVSSGFSTTAQNQMSILNIHRVLLVSCIHYRPLTQMIRGSNFRISRWKPLQASEGLRAHALHQLSTNDESPRINFTVATHSEMSVTRPSSITSKY